MIRDIRLLLQHATGLDAVGFHTAPARVLTAAEHADFNTMLARLMAGVPVTRILGAREFRGLMFRLGPATLDPRPDSETVLDAMEAHCPDRSAALSVLDLGTGTGCLIVSALDAYPKAGGLAVDRSFDALQVARDNATRNGVADRLAFLCADWTAPLNGARFDVVLSNPPYIPSGDMAALDASVRNHDPALALYGGPDGLAAYRTIIAALPGLLAPGGVAILEIGAGTGPAVTGLLPRHAPGLSHVDTAMDLNGLERALIFQTCASQEPHAHKDDVATTKRAWNA